MLKPHFCKSVLKTEPQDLLIIASKIELPFTIFG